MQGSAQRRRSAGLVGLIALGVTGMLGVASTAAAADPVPVVVTASDESMSYGGTLPVVVASYSGFPDGTDAADLATAPTCAADPVTATTSCSGAADPRYSFTYVSGSLTVDPVPLTITASDENWELSEPLPVPTPSYAGLVAGDPEPAIAPVCAAHEATWTTSCSGAADPHYTIDYVDGRLTGYELGPAPLAPAGDEEGADPRLPVAPSAVDRAATPVTVLPDTGSALDAGLGVLGVAMVVGGVVLVRRGTPARS